MLLLTWLACAPADAPELSPADQDTLRRFTVDLVDTSRPLPPIGAHPGSDERAIEVWGWVGAATAEQASGRPLLVMAHGVSGHPEKFDAFAADLAEQGIVVIAPVFPASNRDREDALLAVVYDLVNQPGDLSFTLDWALDAHGEVGGVLQTSFDPDALAVLGHSLGGATVLGLTRHPSVQDERFEAVVLVAAAAFLTDTFGDAQIATGPPTLLVHGTEDPAVPISSSMALREELSPTWLLELPGTGHSEMLESQDVPAIDARDGTQRAVAAHIAEALLGEAGARDAALDALEAEGMPVN